MSNNKKEESILEKIFVPVIIALVVGGAAPWWWDKIFVKNNPTVTTSPTSSPSVISSPSETPITPISPQHSADSAQQTPVLTEAKQSKEDVDLNLRFGLQGCQRSSNIVTCYFLLTKQADVNGLYAGRGYYIYANYPSWGTVSRAITPDGEQYSAQSVQAGDDRGDYIVVRPIKGVPLRIGISFNLPTQFQSLNAFAIQYQFQADIAERREIAFENVTISQ